MPKRQQMKKTSTTHFGIQRKIVANMTAESWETIPHVTYNYEPDVTEFMIEYQRLNENCAPEDKITLNTLMLKIIVEGLKADPAMNAHIDFDRKLVRGEIHTFEDINISMPMVLPNGEMMTINLHNFENKNLNQMADYIKDVNRRVAKLFRARLKRNMRLSPKRTDLQRETLNRAQLPFQISARPTVSREAKRACLKSYRRRSAPLHSVPFRISPLLS